jgi:CHAT domain-containing protein/cytochrome c-type biogenesis protein CcmH/NrfG
MSEKDFKDLDFRGYLLGRIKDESQLEVIEQRLLFDEQYLLELELQEEELIEDYVEQALTSDEKQSFENHFLISHERRENVKILQALRKHIQNQESKEQIEINKKSHKENIYTAFFRRLLTSPKPIAAALVIFVFLSFLYWNFYIHRSETQEALASLNRAYQTERPFESRITSFNYAPYNITRGNNEEKVELTERNRAERILLDQVLENPNAENIHFLGRLYLAKKDFDQAINQLEKAKQLNSQNAEILNDLGVAFFEKSKIIPQEGDGERLRLSAMSLENLQKAIEINPSFIEARFNIAISLQNSSAPKQAQEAWSEYLKLDPVSPWAEEARRNLKQLELNQPQVKTSDQILHDFITAYKSKDDEKSYQIVSRNREMITSKLVPQQLAFLFLDGKRAERNEYLSALTYLGEIEKKRSGDTYFLDIAKFYATLTEGKREISRIAQISIKKGYELSLKDNYQEALSEFTNARELFEDTNNIWEAGICNYWIGYSLNRLNQIEKSTQVLRDLANFSQNKGYKWLASQAYGWLAINMVTSKELSKAIEYNQKAIYFAEEVFDLYNTQKTLMQQADVYRRIQDYDQAMAFAQRGLQLGAFAEVSPRQKLRDYYTVSGIFLGMKFYSTALIFRKESLVLAEEQLVDTFVYLAYIDLGLIYGIQEKYEESFDSFDKGRKIAEKFTNEELKRKSFANADLQLAHIKRKTKNCLEALNNYDKALSFYDSGEFQVNRYDAHKGRLLCYYETKNESALESELPIILSIFRDYRAKILEEQSRNIFFDNEHSIYDIAINYAFEKRNFEEAFNYSEESRSRSLLDLQNSSIKVNQNALIPEIKFPQNVTEPRMLSEIRTQIPDNVQIVQYSVLSNRILIWLLKKEEFSVIDVDISEEDLYEKAKSFSELISKNSTSEITKQNALATELYQILISPIKEKLDPKKEICLIPDKILLQLPFSAFTSPQDGQFFIAQYKFFLSPSANIFLNSSKKAKELNKNIEETLLSIGNPAFSKKDFVDLPNLDTAEQEAKEISKLYKKSILLTKKEALKEKIKTELLKADVFHFAGHYVVNEKYPLLSGLLLAEDIKTHEKRNSELANHEIINDKLSQPRLVVLSACQTGIERFYNGEGIIGAARTFLAAGIPLIVASQWKVDSDSTRELMIRFHRYRKTEKLSTSAALQRAQLDLLQSEDLRFQNPYYWAAFITLGGYSEF